MTKSNRLNDEVKAYIVTSLACFDTPAVVAEAVKREFGETITRQTVECYDPNKRAGSRLSEKWKQVFEETRRAFLDDTSKIGISHRSVRLRALDRMASRAEERGNMVLAKDLLKQAAEEMGNAYTNRRELTGKDGKDLPAPVAPVTIFQLPDNERD